MKLSNFVSSLSDCQILVAPCQCGCQWVALAGERVTRFQATFALWKLPNIPFSNLDPYLPFALYLPRLFLSETFHLFPSREYKVGRQ